MSIDFQALLLPITAQEPSGQECCETPEYEQIFTEIQNLTSPVAARQPDWNKVEDLASEIFIKISKDFVVGAWLAAAWTEKSGLEGIKAGLGLFNGLVKDYWKTSYPGLKRIRGRRSGLIWWSDRVSGWLSSAQLSAISQQEHDALVKDVTALDHALGELDPEAPPLQELIRLLSDLEVIQAAADVDVLASTSLPNGQAVQSADIANAPGSVSGAMVSEEPVIASPSMPVLTEITTVDGLIDALSPVLNYLGDVSQTLSQIDPLNPLAISLARVAARSAMVALPQATGQQTLIAPPPNSDIQSFEAVMNAGNPEGLVGYCEARISTYPFWLDLDYQSALAYAAQGTQASAMRETVVDEVLAFVKRLPGVELLTFSDGRPFASDATRAWIIACQDEHRAGSETDDFLETKTKANTFINQGKIDEAIVSLQKYLSSTRSGRDRFRARLALAQMALGARQDIDPRPLVEPLVEECERLDLVQWEPELALAAWNLKLRASQVAHNLAIKNENTVQTQQAQEAIDSAIKMISMIDFSEAIRQISA